MLIHLDKLHVAIAFSCQDHHVGVRVVEGDQDSRRHVQVQLVLRKSRNGDEYVIVIKLEMVMVMKLVMIMQKRLIALVPILMQIKATWTTLGLRRSLRINWRARSPVF